jgi:hypothetical protein
MVVLSIRVSSGSQLHRIKVNGGTELDGVAPVGMVIFSKVLSIKALSNSRSAEIATLYRSPVVGEFVGPAQIVVGIRGLAQSSRWQAIFYLLYVFIYVAVRFCVNSGNP